MNGLKSIALFLALATAFLFAALAVNQEQVALTFAVWQTPFTLSIFWWLLSALVVGIALGALYGGWVNVRYRFANRRLRKALEKPSNNSPHNKPTTQTRRSLRSSKSAQAKVTKAARQKTSPH